MYIIKVKKKSNTVQVKTKQNDIKVVSVGKRGIQGIVGPQGNAGPGFALGGATGQYIRKASLTDYDTEWHSLTTDEISDTGQIHKFVTTAQKSLIDAAIQPGDNITDLNNNAGFITDITSFTTSNLAEGSNLYYTQTRFNNAFAAKSTSDLSEGSNLYYTNSRVDARIALQAGASNGLATLGSDGKIPTSQLPALAITDTFVVSTQAEMLALTAEVGDIAVRTDLNKSYILRTTGASTLANWQELLTPTDAVLSVNGQTGAVTLTTSNISEGSNLYYTTARVQTDGDARYVKLAGSTMTGKLVMNVSGDFAIDLGSSAMKANKIVVDGTPKSFTFPYTINGYQPETFIYLDSQYHVFRIGAQYPSDITQIAFELPNNNEYQDVMALSKTSLSPAAALNNSIALGTSGNKWKSIYIGTDPSVIQGTLTLGSLSGVLKASTGLISGGATTSDLTEGSNLYYTDERVDDRVAALLVAGAGISLTYNDAGNALTVANVLNPVPSDLTASGPQATLTAGENLAFGDVVYIKSDGKMWKADADALSTATSLFMAVATILADAVGLFAMPGSFVRNDAGWSWTVGGTIYLSGTTGALTQTAPTTTDSVTQIMGVATHADRIFFYPQLVQVVHT